MLMVLMTMVFGDKKDAFSDIMTQLLQTPTPTQPRPPVNNKIDPISKTIVYLEDIISNLTFSIKKLNIFVSVNFQDVHRSTSENS